MTPDPHADEPHPQINSEGGSVVHGNVSVAGGDFVGRDKNIFQTFFGGSAEAERLRNRRIMVQKVHDFWVKGVLENSLYRNVLVALGMTPQPDAVSHRPWQTVVHLPDQPDRPLPEGTSMATVFAQMEERLLILGEPGAGKTTMMLDLVRERIAAWAPEAGEPMPVVFNLSSWAVEKLPLVDWLVDELRRNYQVSRKLAQEWVETDALTLFLDGLDEVREDVRDDCVTAINAYRDEHASVAVCVCCRRAEYEALQPQLTLSGAVLIRPLTRFQVQTYLARLGDSVSGLLQALAQNDDLWALAESPLILNIMVFAYQDKPADHIARSLGNTDPSTHLFSTYIAAMFNRTARTEQVEPVPYTQQQTVHWLSWLAHQLRTRSQTTFLIERLQPSWYSGSGWIYRLAVSLMIGLFVGLFVGLLIGFGYARDHGPMAGLRNGLSGGLTFTLIGSLVYGLLQGAHEQVKPAEILTTRWNGRRFLAGLLIGALLGLIVAINMAMDTETIIRVFVVLLFGAATGLLYGLLDVQYLTRSTRPNQGSVHSLENGLRVGLMAGPFFGLLFGLLFEDLSFGLLFGMFFTAGFALRFGGLAFLQHAILRLLLYRASAIPWHYARFLDYAAERIFLRKVGGGYIFIHRLLLEYFADLYEET